MAEVYDPILDTWTRKADLHTTRANLFTIVFNGKICGGALTPPPLIIVTTMYEYESGLDH